MAAPVTFELDDVYAGPVDDPILRGITGTVPCAGVTALAGPSGAGKTTLLRLFDRLDEPTAGTIRWNGRVLGEWDPQELRRRAAMIFQRPPVFAGTVFDNLVVADDDITSDQAAAVLARVGLDPALLERKAGDLSGGEAQRMCFARALLTKPAVLLADEPTSSLDTDSRTTIEQLGCELARDGVPIIWVTHDIDQLRAIADHVVVMVRGCIVASGTLAEMDAHDDADVRRWVGAR